jgi:hypothetical protein
MMDVYTLSEINSKLICISGRWIDSCVKCGIISVELGGNGG